MAELKLKIKKQNIQVFKDVVSRDDAEDLIMQNKEKAFSMMSSVKGMFGKKELVDVTHVEKRFEPFWYIRAESYLEYKRNNQYKFSVEPQVRSVRINGKDIDVQSDNPVCVVDGVDHCVEHNTKRVLTSAIDPKHAGEKELKQYLKFDSRVIKETEALMGKDKVVVPAKIRASYYIRDLVKDLIKAVHADTIIDERIEFTDLILFFRPIWAFELQKGSKVGVLEVDALTKEVKRGKVFKRELAELIGEDLLFEIGAELAGTIIPGAGIGAVIGKKVKERRKQKSDQKLMQKSQKALALKKRKK